MTQQLVEVVLFLKKAFEPCVLGFHIGSGGYGVESFVVPGTVKGLMVQ